MEGGDNLDTKDVVKRFNNFELIVIHERTIKHLRNSESKVLENLLSLLNEEILDRNIG